MGINELRKKNNIPSPVKPQEKTGTAVSASERYPGNEGYSEQPGPYMSGPYLSGPHEASVDGDRIHQIQDNSCSGNSPDRQSVEPGIFGGDYGDQNREQVHVDTSGEITPVNGIGVKLSAFFRNLPYLWQIDAICILLTAVGMTAIIINLDAVLFFIFSILYSVISLVFSLVFCICLLLGGILMFRRRGNR